MTQEFFSNTGFRLKAKKSKTSFSYNSKLKNFPIKERNSVYSYFSNMNNTLKEREAALQT